MQQLHSPEEAAQWLRRHGSTSLRCDSRHIGPGEGFIAWPGTGVDGRQFVAQALQRGARACLVEAQGVDAFAADFAHALAHAAAPHSVNPSQPPAQVACYAGLKAATGAIAAHFYDHPSAALSMVAVTGTNGKTSTAWWLAQALTTLPAAWAQRCGVIGTLGVGRIAASGAQAADLVPTGLTTPDPVLLQHTLRDWVQGGAEADADAGAGVQVCAIEASSIGLAEHRLDGCQIRVAVFTNFTQDHLDYHGSMQAYWQAKQALFAWPGLQAAVVNVDDAQGAALAASLAHTAADRGLDVWAVSCEAPARLWARGLRYAQAGMVFDVVEADQVHTLHTQAIGAYNVANLLGVLAAMRSLGVPLAQAVAACSGLAPVPGRMDLVTQPGQPLVAVDYAHTPDALHQALIALRPMAQARGGQLWCVFGCGGDRDASKRPLMGAVAMQWADRVVLTSDNPRHEKPQDIIAQILAGARAAASQPGQQGAPQGQPLNTPIEVQANRAQAIAQCIANAGPDDVILLAGKGHEATQDTAGEKTPFSDRAHALQALQLRSPSHSGSAPTSSSGSVGTSLTPNAPRRDGEPQP
jgi:UDP-N-acetylmuramyl-tripeptide synthetase